MVHGSLRWLSVISLALVSLGSACSPYKYTDDDNVCSKAKPLPFGVAVKDELSMKTGDVSDCKEIKYFKDAQAQLELRLGTAFEKHDLRGVVTIYDSEGNQLQQESLDPAKFKYDFEFAVREKKSYFMEVKINEGNYAYSSQVTFKAADPCDACKSTEECVDGECRKKEIPCDPECDGDEGELCVEGECKYQCPSDCRKRKGYSCDAVTGECVKVLMECRPSCKSGYSCNRRNGQCVAVSLTCKGGCKPGELCRSGKCEPLSKPAGCPPCAANQRCDAASAKCVAIGEAPQPAGNITGTVTSTVRAPDGTVLYLNRGSTHEVKIGKTGTLCGTHKFVVTNVYPTRSKAKTAATIEAIGSCAAFSVAR